MQNPRGRNRLVNNFAQQKLKAWQPVLTPKWITTVFVGFGLAFIVLGVVLLLASNRVRQCVLEYGDPQSTCYGPPDCTPESKTLDESMCVGPSGNVIRAPVYVYYELNGYYQNHRRYVKSRNDQQLRGEVFTDPKDLSSCDPIIQSPEGKVYSPCGLVAWSVFNDTYQFFEATTEIKVNDNASVIAWYTDVEQKFKNPDSNEVKGLPIDEWLDESIFPGKVENGHFIVWMRNAALPDFRKLYGKIEQDISLPLTVKIFNRYPMKSFQGRKKVVLSTTSWLGGRNSFLGIAYLVIGGWCFLFGCFFIFKNHRNPRILGDVRYLKWVVNPKGN